MNRKKEAARKPNKGRAARLNRAKRARARLSRVAPWPQRKPRRPRSHYESDDLMRTKNIAMSSRGIAK